MVFKINSKIIFMFLCLSFLINDYALAEYMPMPPNTHILNQEELETAQGDKKVIFAETSMAQESIKEFYRKELQSKGYSVVIQLEGMALYSKGDDMFLITISPENKGKTSLVLTSGKLDLKNQQQKKETKCTEIPGIAVYPGAECIDSMYAKMRKAHIARYAVSVGTEDVANFYKIQMQKSGWALDNEMDLGDNLPPKIALENKSSLKSLRGAKNIVFINPSNKKLRCTLNLIPVFPGGGTMLSITYFEDYDENFEQKFRGQFKPGA
ncbi:MAG: hypothetical protein COV72_05750 [Candidatus Omnitrophica bacterium CG11_big_fil_rev_8_21_14_0_20_42_13]|uniref:Uncharacterized protein n=1 Tax=Candidatus Ghiorseimicrobium undicola TaxID=1974746 RepID=A0A2H0LX48_9BACT|nr:MAG: hypothetical protein COV72_05750 [Candidatus Omnitrophica bacterium CG11_big_fil_rev_8_21_14_0_20_42_13]